MLTDTDKATILNALQKKEEVDPFNQLVNSIAMDGYTMDFASKLKLSAYPDEAIIHSFKQAKKMKVPIANAARYIFKVASEYCREHNLRPDWKWSFKLLDAYGINKDIPLGMTPLPQDLQATPPVTTEAIPVKEIGNFTGMRRLESWRSPGLRFTAEESLRQAQLIYDDSESLAKLAKLMGMEKAIQFRDRVIQNHVNNLI